MKFWYLNDRGNVQNYFFLILGIFVNHYSISKNKYGTTSDNSIEKYCTNTESEQEHTK